MRTWGILAAGIALAATAGVVEAQERQLGPHEHGRGSLNIALEGSRLSMELEAPGMDIVGFEHPAKSAKQKSAVEAAKKQLAGPQRLFELPAAAGCTLKEAKVAIEAEDHGHGQEVKDQDAKSDPAGTKEAKEQAEPEHSAFRAEYAFDCKAPASLTTIGFAYFKAFAGAQKLDVTVVTPKQQNKFEVTRSKPNLDLGGMM